MLAECVSAMNVKSKQAGFLRRLRWSIPWLRRYPLWAIDAWFRRIGERNRPQHLIFVVANHFEPSWNEDHKPTDWVTQQLRLEHWCKQARAIGRAVQDCDGVPFRHTYFFPAEQYHPSLLDRLAEEQAHGFGEVEIHLHHGVQQPDDASNLRRTLEDFRDILAQKHRCLSRLDGVGRPMYAFVHGNFALANSLAGLYCGVDSEMQILAETGCYADFTLPAVPHQSQVPRINAIYQCGRPLHERSPHRSGPNLHIGDFPTLPILFSGPLVFDWHRAWYRLLLPRIEDGLLASNRPPTLDRLKNWCRAGVGIRGKPEWVFIKFY